MAKKRTKVEKRRASERRKLVILKPNTKNQNENKDGEISEVDTKITTPKLVLRSKQESKLEKSAGTISLLGYDLKLLKQDLVKTLLLSAVMFGGVVGLYFYLR